MRNESQVKMNSDLYNKATRATHLTNEINWSAANYHNIKASFDTGIGKDLKKAPRVKNKPIICVGSGVTLDYSIEYMKEWDHDIICSTSQATTLIYNGIEPKYILALDPNSAAQELQCDVWQGRDCNLVTHPGIMPETIEFWVREQKMPIYYFRKFMPQTVFYANAQKLMYSEKDETGKYKSMIDQEIVMLGCAANAQVSIANALGYGPIYTVGCDFGYLDNKVRFDAVRYNHDRKEWVVEKSGSIEIEKDQVLSENGIVTSGMQIFYKRNFMSCIRIELPQIVNTGINTITEIPYCDIKTVVEKQGIPGNQDDPNEPIKILTKEEMINITERYMATFGLYVVRHKNGIEFLECEGVTDLQFIIDKARYNSIKQLEAQRDSHRTTAVSALQEDKAALVTEFKNIGEWYLSERKRIEEDILEDETIEAAKKIEEEMDNKKVAVLIAN